MRVGKAKHGKASGSEKKGRPQFFSASSSTVLESTGLTVGRSARIFIDLLKNLAYVCSLSSSVSFHFGLVRLRVVELPRVFHPQASTGKVSETLA